MISTRDLSAGNLATRQPEYPTALVRHPGRRWLLPWLVASIGSLLAFAALPILIHYEAGERAVIALCTFGVLYVANSAAPIAGACMLLIYLATMGMLRRWLVQYVGWTGSDPLLLVGPAIALLSFTHITRTRCLPRDTWPTRLILWLLCCMAFEIFNPLQGWLTVGLGGAIFYIVPVFWFYLGHRVGPDALPKILRVTLILSLLACVYGLYHSLVGLLPFEKIWFDTVGSKQYAAIMIDDGVVRAFAFFSNAQEYAQFLDFGVVLLWAAVLRGRVLALVPIGVLTVALFLESSRADIVMTVVACTLMWAMQGPTFKSWIPRSMVAVFLGLCGLVWTMTQIQQHQASFDSRTGSALSHNTDGILNPLDDKKSTATSHYNMMNEGIVKGMTNPVGVGLGATTLAGAKFGEEGGNTEMDVSNLFLSLGPVGGLLYVGVVVVLLRTLCLYWLRTRSPEVICLIGMLTATVGQWLNGGYYSTVMVLWFCLGTVIRANRELPA